LVGVRSRKNALVIAVICQLALTPDGERVPGGLGGREFKTIFAAPSVTSSSFVCLKTLACHLT
jgi:hypothetical protein